MNKTKHESDNGSGRPEIIKAPPPSVTASMNGTADSMERLYKAINQAEELCMRLTGSLPKSRMTELPPSLPNVDGDNRSLADVAAAQAATLKIIAERIELAVAHISDAI